MKNSKIEKQLKNELNANAPSDFESVWSKCATTKPLMQAEYAIEAAGDVLAGRQKPVRSIVALILCVALFCSFIVASFLWGMFDAPLRFKKGSFLFDVNPSVEVFYDEEGMVTQANGLNDDGKALLVGISLMDKSYAEAADTLFERCVKMGYFMATRENNALLVTAVSENGDRDATMTKALKKCFVEEFLDNKLRGVVITGVSNPKLSAQAEKYGIDGQKYGLILSYLECGGTLSESEYATISVRELYALLETQEQEFKRAKTEQTKIILAKFEKELQETLSEQIDVLLRTLDVCLPSMDEPSELGKFDKLKEYVSGLETAVSAKERKGLIDKILTELSRLKEAETDVMIVELIESAKVSISVTYNFFESTFYRLKKISATPEEIQRIRLYKFAAYGTENENYDFEAWQNDHETLIAKTWYECKAAWKAERQKDF